MANGFTRSGLRYHLSRGPAERQTGTDKVLVEETGQLVASGGRLGITEQSAAVCGRARAPQALRGAKESLNKEKDRE